MVLEILRVTKTLKMEVKFYSPTIDDRLKFEIRQEKNVQHVVSNKINEIVGSFPLNVSNKSNFKSDIGKKVSYWP